MRKPELWLAAALYEETRRGLPDLCRNMGCRVIHWPPFDNAPDGLKQPFVDLSKGIVEGITGFLEDEDATAEGTQGGEREEETGSNGGMYERDEGQGEET